MKTILLKMAGPLQSWGTRSHFETRHTDFYPSKSAMIGLLSACLGYKRDRQEDITALNELDFAVRIDRQGNLLRDYHTARKYKPNGDFERTYVTNRYYLEDAVFVVALGHTDTARMDTIEEAVKNPYFQPFMGRRSLPLTADFFLDSSEEGVLDALAAVPWQGHRRGPEPDFVQLPIYADAHLLPEKPKKMRSDRVLSFSQKERKFGYRPEARSRTELRLPAVSTEHDAFGAIGGDDVFDKS